nr:DNA methyltransferase [Rhodococcus sp. 06-1059B-a]
MDAQLGSDLEVEIHPLQARLPFGLNFERHAPEAVELPGHRVRKGSKVRILPPRGSVDRGDQRLWRVDSLTGDSATVSLMDSSQDESASVQLDDLILVAEFRERIYPGLRADGSVERGSDKPFHTIINGENFHVLEQLSFTHENAIDAIYIDPPYNTGARDWKYNNDYVEGDDLYRHSKWLAFMERRLKVAKRLLNPGSSVLIVTIDEKEYLRLGLLLEQTFPHARIQMVSVVINPNGVARSAELARVEEYVYFCFFGDAAPVASLDSLLDQGTRQRTNVRWEWLMRGGSNSRRIDRPNLFYPIFINEADKVIAEVGEPVPLAADPADTPDRPGLLTLWPVRGNGEQANWRTSPEYLRELLEAGYARLGEKDRRSGRWSILYLGKAQIARITSGEISVVGRNNRGFVELESDPTLVKRTVKTVWNRPQHSAGEHGSRMLRGMLPQRSFPFPKSLYAVEDALRIAVGHKRDATVLDYFAGSGTTAHALMRLNKQDGGQRRAILVTNNEVSVDEQRGLRAKGLRPGDLDWEKWGICDFITKPRIRSAITGTTPDAKPLKGDYRFSDIFPMADGFDENAAFFTLTYESPWRVSTDRAFAAIAPMLWLRAGAQGRRIEALAGGWDVGDTYAIIKDLDQSSDFIDAVRAADRVRLAYIVTDDEGRYQQIANDLPGLETVRLYEDYLRNCESTGDF